MERNANVFEFQGSKMIVSAKGPNFNKNFTMNTSFRPNLLSSTMNMPRNFEKQGSSVASQKSIYHGRDSSPTPSICSDLQPRNFHQPFHQRGYSQRSVYNREGSPMSMRSIDSTASRAEIVIDAIKTCTEDEWKKIWHAVNRKHEFRKKAQKRWKMKMFLKNLQNRSEDEGEQGSRSSISSDDCASTRTGYSRRYDPYCKENVPQSLKSFDRHSEDTYRSTKAAYRGYARSESQNPYQTGTNPYHPAKILPFQKQPKFGPTNFVQKNGYSQNESTIYSQSNTGFKNRFSSQNCVNGQASTFSIQRNNLNSSMCSTKSMQNMTAMSQRDRFRAGFQFPSQKFNRFVSQEDQEHIRNQQFSNKHSVNKEKTGDHIDELSDENDDIFLDTTVKPKTVAKKTEKRKIDNLDDIPNPTKKKPKITASNDKAKKQAQNKNVNEKNEFEFVKPQFPIRKSAPAKPQEKLISKSSGAPDLITNTQENHRVHPQPAAPSPEPDGEPELSENTQLTTTDMSMRPSFMKRKLFTQTLDVTEKKNNSFESGTDSPQSNIYSVLTREKHKARKLVTSQSLLSRDVNQDDDNLLDLIHKIVPPNQVNSTVTANTSKANSRVSGTKNANDDKWDISSIISTCNNDSVSETYTDDEIFRFGNDDKKTKVQENPVPKKGKTDHKNNKPIEVKDKPKQEIKITENTTNPTKEVVKKITLPAAPKVATPAKVCPAKRVVLSRSRIDAFWDTDESDYECAGARRAIPPWNLQDQTQNHIASPKQTSTEIQSNTLSKAKTDQTKVLSPLVVLHELQKNVKKQPSKKNLNKSKNEPKTLKKSNDVTKANKLDKTLKGTPTVTLRTKRQLNQSAQSNDVTKPNKLDKTLKGTPTVTLRTRRQLNQSALSETLNNSLLNKKDTLVNETAPTKTTTQKKQRNDEKANQEKNVKTKPSSETKNSRNKKQKDSQHQINMSKKHEDTPKSQRTVKKDVKTTKLREPAEHLKIDICKVLRSRHVDLSSSFNSDKFELTMSRTRKSRTPSKRISFNKSKNVLVNNNKIRSKATKS